MSDKTKLALHALVGEIERLGLGSDNFTPETKAKLKEIKDRLGLLLDATQVCIERVNVEMLVERETEHGAPPLIFEGRALLGLIAKSKLVAATSKLE